MRKGSKLFFKYLLSYLLVLVLPMIIFSGIYGNRVNNVYREEILTNMRTDLQSLAANLDNQLSAMSATVEQLSIMVDFNGYRFESDPLYARYIMQLLQMYCNTSTFAEEIILYMHDDEYLISSKSTCHDDVFSRWVYRYEDSQPDELLQTFRNVTVPTVLKNQAVTINGSTENYITILMPVYTDYLTIKGTAIFLIRTSTIAQLVNEKFSQYEAGLSILDANNSMFFGNNIVNAAQGEIEQLSAEAVKENAKQLDFTDELTNAKYSVHSTVSPRYQFKYLALIPTNSSFSKRLEEISRSQASGVISVIAIAIVLIFVLMRINYSPLKRLREKASKVLPLFENKTDTLQAISSTLDFLSDQNVYLTSKFEDSLQGVKNVRLQELLVGRYQTNEQFNNSCANVNLALPHNNFMVSCMLQKNVQGQSEQMAERLREELPHWITTYYVFTVQPEKLYFIHNFTSTSVNTLAKHFEKARINIEKQTGLVITIGLGGVVEGCDSIPKSYLQAGTALDYRFVKGNGNTILFDEIIKDSTTVHSYPRSHFERLKNAIVSCNDTAAEGYVSDIADYIERHNLPLFTAKGLCFDIVSLFLEYGPDTAITNTAGVNLLMLTDVDTVREVIHRIRELKSSVYRGQGKPQNENDAKKLAENIVEYVNKHYLRCDFQIAQVSEEFNMLLPNLSQFFKDQTGQNILDYATNLRMERAKQMLIETEIPLKELGYQVGYYNVSSFIRRFKQTQGVTPGDYRRLYSSPQGGAE